MENMETWANKKPLHLNWNTKKSTIYNCLEFMQYIEYNQRNFFSIISLFLTTSPLSLKNGFALMTLQIFFMGMITNTETKSTANQFVVFVVHFKTRKTSILSKGTHSKPVLFWRFFVLCCKWYQGAGYN